MSLHSQPTLEDENSKEKHGQKFKDSNSRDSNVSAGLFKELDQWQQEFNRLPETY